MGARELLVWLELWVEGELVSENMVLFVRPKHLNLLPPDLQYNVRQTGAGRFEVELSGRTLALWVWLSTADGDCVYSDNFFHLLPGSTKVVRVTTQQTVSANELHERLQVQSLVDTYAEPALQPGSTARQITGD
jgi:beta-mannosidase